VLLLLFLLYHTAVTTAPQWVGVWCRCACIVFGVLALVFEL